MRMFVLCVLALLASASYAQPFTYQGELRQGGIAAGGPHDFVFRVYPVPVGGTPLGATVFSNGVNVVEGRFAVEIDPTDGVFTGAERWLDIEVRPSGAGGYTTLTPRQRITPAPYAIRSLNEWLVPTFSDTLRNDPTRPRLFINRDFPITASEYFGITTPTAGVNFGGMYVNTQSGQGKPFYGYASGGAVRSYTYHDSVSNQWRLSVVGGDRLAVTSTGDIGIGTLTPAQRLDVAGTVQAENFRYVTPRQRVISLPASAFMPRSSSSPWIVESPQGFTYYEASVGTGNFNAPITLPNGAVVTEIIGYFRDNSGAVNITLNVLTRLFTATNYTGLATASTTGADLAIQAIAPQPMPFVIDNTTRSYILSVFCSDWEGLDTAISAVRITYTVNEPD